MAAACFWASRNKASKFTGWATGVYSDSDSDSDTGSDAGTTDLDRVARAIDFAGTNGMAASLLVSPAALEAVASELSTEQLAILAEAASTGRLSALPTVTIDLEAVLANPAVADATRRSILATRRRVDAVVGTGESSIGLAWRAATLPSAGAATFLADVGVDTVLIDPSIIDPDGDDADGDDPDGDDADGDGNPNPSVGRLDVEGYPDGLHVIASDASVSAWLTDPTFAVDGPDDGGPTAIETEAIAATEVLLRLGEETETPIVVADAPDGSRLAAAGTLLEASAIAAPLDHTPPNDAIPAAPPAPAAPDLPEGFVAQLERLSAIGGLVIDPAQRDRLDDQVLAGLEAEVAPNTRQARVTAFTETLDDIVGGVRLAGARTLNLTSQSGTVPVAVVNDNPFAVRVEVVASAARLRFPDGASSFHVIAPGETRIDLDVEALATGSVPVAVELRVPDTDTILDQRRLNVRSTSVSGVGVALSIGALGILGVWWFRTWRADRRRRGGDREPAGLPD